MVIPQWRIGLSALAYRCGGSIGFIEDHLVLHSPISRLTPPGKEARHLERKGSIYADRPARLLRRGPRCMLRLYGFDARLPITYSQRMDLDLKGLEERVSQLIELSRRLRAENGTLRQQLVVAHNENKQLAERMESARQRVEALLERVPPVPERNAD
jgi:cell division protein ZapB